MSTRTFEHFPESEKCPICNTNKDESCILIPIQGTEKGDICKAKPFHLNCITKNLDEFWYIEDKNLLYRFI